MSDEQTMSAEELFADLANPANRSTSIKELAECMMVEFGGPAGLAHKTYLAFEANAVGNPNQIRILGDNMKLLLGIDSDAAGDDNDDLESLEATHRQLSRQYREDS